MIRRLSNLIMAFDTNTLPRGHFLFTSESVTEGHPDKLCDCISDAVLDACLAQDHNSKVACETVAKSDLLMIIGEISTKAHVNYEQVVRNTIREIGYTSSEVGLDADQCNIVVGIETQSPDIAQAVHLDRNPQEIGAGDQGHMFGYATNETPELMPLSHSLASKLSKRLADARNTDILPWIRPDGKTQVTIEYKKEAGVVIPVKVHTIVISVQHSSDVSLEEIRTQLKETVVKPVVPSQYLTEETIYHLNPSGKFTIGGPYADAGLTGRKVILDTYGGWGAHGGGAFSGKDPSKVDRSAAYAARWIAKSLVKADLCDRVLIQLSYAIGIKEPLSVHVDSYGTVKHGRTDKDLLHIVLRNFDLRPGCIIRDLNLLRPIFRKTAAYGHFGRENDPDFSWEVPKDLVYIN